ncbi:MAG: hypothetical protein AB8H79_07715 [Myxococcota bacterium]
MKIHSTSVIDHPIDRVWRAYRDELPEIAKTIPDIHEVRELSRSERDGGVTIHNEWHSSASLPPLVGRVIKPEHLRWDDFAEWDDVEHHLDWSIKTRVFTERIRCGGRNRFEAVGEDKTKLIIDGDLQIDFDRLPGMPRMVSKRVGPRLESFFVSLITPNLQKVTVHLAQYLDRQ